VRWVCDLDHKRAEKTVGRYATIRVTSSITEVLDDDAVDAVVVATPAATHVEVASAALQARKHVLLEKPLAPTVAEGTALVELAEQEGLVLMCDHTYCYTPAVQRIRDLVATGTIGDVLYVDSVRINLGPWRTDVDALWDLAPHDLSILDFILPERWAPVAVAALGADPVRSGRPCMGFLTMPLRGGGVAHIHVNWLSPTKIRTMVLGGSRRTLVWDDLNPSQRLSVFDRGVDVAPPSTRERHRELQVSFRLGEMIAPALPEVEALQNVVSEFLSAIEGRRSALTDGRAGLRVLHIMEAAEKSIADGSRLVPLT